MAKLKILTEMSITLGAAPSFKLPQNGQQPQTATS